MSKVVALVIPVRGFDDAKSRLSSVLEPAQRRQLAQNCAQGVLDRTVDCPRFVVCDDDEVESWALSLGATPVRVQSRGLNASLTEAIPLIARQFRVDFMLIAHADLPLPDDLDRLITTIQESKQTDEIIVVPDLRRDGTNVLGLDASLIDRWTFRYGESSFEAHVQQANLLGCRTIIVDDSNLGLDLDTETDLAHPSIIDILPKLLPDWNLP